MKRYFLFFLIIFSLKANSQKTGQAAIDSLLIVLPNIKNDSDKIINLHLIAEEFTHENPYKGIEYGKQALVLSNKLKNSDFIALSLIYISLNQSELLDTGNSEKNLLKASKFATTKLTKCILNRKLGSLQLKKSSPSKALEFFLMALKISEELNNQTEIAKCCFSLGNYYKTIKDLDKILFYLNRSLAINKKLKLKSKVVADLFHIGEFYNRISNYPIAENYFNKAFELNKSLDNNHNIMFINFYKADMYNRQNKFEKALECIEISEKLAEQINNVGITVASKFTKANIYNFKIKNFPKNKENNLLIQKAIKLLAEVIAINEKTENFVNLGLCYKMQSQLYSLQNEHEQATAAMQEYAKSKDYIFSEKSKETIENLEDQRTIDLKNKEILINKITLESKEKQKWIYIFGIGFLTILGFSLFYQNQIRKKTNEKLQVLNNDLDQANKTKIKFLSILNHDLRSPVYNFIHFMQLQKESPELLDEKTKIEIENKTILSAENLLISMEDLLLWSKGEMENFEPKPENVFISKIFMDIKNHFASEEKVKISFENHENIEIFTDENYLKTIIRNFTGNAINALSLDCAREDKTPTIIWKAYQVNNKIFLSITDNGAGTTLEKLKALFNDTEVVGIKTGLGLHLIRDLAKAINCEISVDSKIDGGTTFLLKFL